MSESQEIALSRGTPRLRARATVPSQVSPPLVDLETVTVARLVELLERGRLNSERLVQACLDRIEALDRRGPSLHAVAALSSTALDDAKAADQRRASGKPYGPLTGIPVLLKGNIDVAGMPTTAGSVALAHSQPSGDADLVMRLRQAGAVIVGKVNLTEFANYLAVDMPDGYSSLGGQVLNPYDASRSPGGSSSGSAVAVAAGLAPLAVGTETSGSILSPCCATSTVGLKPTVGLISRSGIVPIAASQDTAGPITRTVADAAILLSALVGIDPRDPATTDNPLAGHDFTHDLRTDGLRGARVGVVTSQIPDKGGVTEPLWQDAIRALTAQGATLVQVDLGTTNSANGGSTVLSYEFKRDLNTYLSQLPDGAPMRSLAEIIAYNDAHAQRALKFGQALALAAQAKDLHPDSADTATYRAHRAGDLADSRERIDAIMGGLELDALLFARTGGVEIGAKAGYPSLTIPAGYQRTNRQPFNITLLAQAWQEPKLIAYGHAFEQHTHARRPPSVINPSLF